jgi:hypothetical protein
MTQGGGARGEWDRARQTYLIFRPGMHRVDSFTGCEAARLARAGTPGATQLR